MKIQEFALVLMPFTKSFEDVYKEAIVPAVEHSDLRCIRVDDTRYPDHIVGKIMDFIYEATIIIADLSSLRPGVVYELGIAHVRGNNTIMISQDRIENELFHLQGYRVLDYQPDKPGFIKLKYELHRLIIDRKKWTCEPNNPVRESWKKYNFFFNVARGFQIESSTQLTNLEFLIHELVGKNQLEEALLLMLGRSSQEHLNSRLNLLLMKLNEVREPQTSEIKSLEINRRLDEIRLEILNVSSSF